MTTGKKFDDGKLPLHLLPTESLEEIAKVLAFGAQKYDSWNWTNGLAWSRVLGATLRHLYKWARGIDVDEESGLNHLAHAGCNILFLLWYSTYRKEYDDRFIVANINLDKS